MRKLRHILGDSKGEGFPLTVAVTISLMLIFLAVMQYARLMITAAGVRDAMQEAVLSAVNDNYADVYHAVREGYAAGYQPYGGGFVESYQYGDIYGRMDSVLGLHPDGDCHISRGAGGDVEYRIRNLQVAVRNGGASSFEITATVDLEMPIRFITRLLPDMKITVRTKAAYTPKF